MNKKIAAVIGIVVLAASLSLSKPSHAGPAAICIKAQLSGGLLGLCNAYVNGQSCLVPQNHDTE